MQRRNRLSRSRDFDAVYRQGRSVSTRFLTLWWYAREETVGDPRLGFAVPKAVGNAVPEIRELCSMQLTRKGGFGAVREFAELLLKARGDWERVVSDYLVERIDTKLEVLR